MFCSFLLNWKSLGHLGGSETFPWQLGLVSAGANCGFCLNRSDGNGAAPECGLMLSSACSNEAAYLCYWGGCRFVSGQLAFPSHSSERGEHEFPFPN